MYFVNHSNLLRWWCIWMWTYLKYKNIWNVNYLTVRQSYHPYEEGHHILDHSCNQTKFGNILNHSIQSSKQNFIPSCTAYQTTNLNDPIQDHFIRWTIPSRIDLVRAIKHYVLDPTSTSARIYLPKSYPGHQNPLGCLLKRIERGISSSWTTIPLGHHGRGIGVPVGSSSSIGTSMPCRRWTPSPPPWPLVKQAGTAYSDQPAQIPSRRFWVLVATFTNRLATPDSGCCVLLATVIEWQRWLFWGNCWLFPNGPLLGLAPSLNGPHRIVHYCIGPLCAWCTRSPR
jgi:hypothetical protein